MSWPASIRLHHPLGLRFETTIKNPTSMTSSQRHPRFTTRESAFIPMRGTPFRLCDLREELLVKIVAQTSQEMIIPPARTSKRFKNLSIERLYTCVYYEAAWRISHYSSSWSEVLGYPDTSIGRRRPCDPRQSIVHMLQWAQECK